MTLISYTYNLVNGTPEDVSQVMANFTTVRNVVNGNIDDSNIKAGAAISQAKIAAGYLPSKLAQEGALTSQAMIWDGTKWAPGAAGSSALLSKSSVEVDITTTTETDMFRYSVPANTLGTDKTVWVHLHGTYTNNSGSGKTLTLRIKYGATTIFNDDSISFASGADRAWMLDTYLTARGSASSEIMYGSMTVSNNNVATSGIGDLTTNDTLASSIGGNATEDSTAAKDYAITCQLSGTSTLRIMWAMAVLLG